MNFLKQTLKLSVLFYLLFCFSRIYFIVYLKTDFEGSVFSVFLSSTFHGFFLDISAIGYLISLPLLVALSEQIAQKKWPNIVYKTSVYIGVSLVFLITISDAELFKQWGSKFNSQVLVYMSHPKEMALSSGAVNFSKTILLGMILGVFVGYAVSKYFKTNQSRILDKRKMLPISLLILGFVFLGIRGGVGVKTMSQSSAFYSSHKIENAAATNSFWNASYYIFNNTASIYSKTHLFYEENEATQNFKEQLSEQDTFSITNQTNPNIIVVMLESFTASASQYFSGEMNCMPYLDAIAKENLSFTSCYASGDRTEKGLISIFSGYPSQPLSSVIVFPEKMQKLPSIIKDYKKQGYQTSFFYGGDVDFASMKSYLVFNETQTIIDKSNFAKKELNSKWGAHDGNLYAKTKTYFDTVSQPFFSSILTLSSHEPFDVPFASNDLKKDDWYGYKNSIRYADFELNNFIEYCKKKPWYKNTIIVLVADHGHDIGLDSLEYFDKKKFHIPLIVLGGALSPNLYKTQIKTPVSQTIISNLLSKKENKGQYGWQTGALNPNGFAQYQYNNGFGRINNSGNCLFNNEGFNASYYPNNKGNDSLDILKKGKIFQQILIQDFLTK